MSDCNSKIKTAIAYHERTEHRLPERFAASLGYLDWKTQPEPFRTYGGAKRFQLPLCDPLNATEPSWAVTRSNTLIPPSTFGKNTFSQFLYDSLAISAWKKSGPSSWALRRSPSSGNLHPTQADDPVRLALPDDLLSGMCPPVSATPNRLSAEHHAWPVLAEVEEATRDSGSPHGDTDAERTGLSSESPASSPSARMLVRRRRSAVDFDGSSGMTREQLYRMLGTLVPALTPTPWTAFPHQPRVHPVLYLHRIEGLEPGLAVLIRNRTHEPALRAAFSRAQHWEKLPGCPDTLPLYRLMTVDAREVARVVHCYQDIAADGALVASMIARFDDEFASFGAPVWRYLHWEAGAIGQLLYLEAEALELSATGIGCFFDQGIHDVLGLEGGRFRMIYGTAIGRAVHDPRIQTLPAYRRRA